MAFGQQEAEQGVLAHVGMRKRLLKAQERKFGFKQRFRWIGGILYFFDSMKPVPGVRHVPKPGKRAKGLEAIAEGIFKRKPEHDGIFRPNGREDADDEPRRSTARRYRF